MCSLRFLVPVTELDGLCHHSLREHPIVFGFAETGSSPIFSNKKTEVTTNVITSIFGAGDRT